MIWLLSVLLNIFFWDKDPETNAKYHSNQHIHKMIVEYAQIASTAYRLLLPSYDGDEIYKKMQQTSNVVVWTAASSAHYDYVVALGLALYEERERRRQLYHAKTWQKGHKTLPVLQWLQNNRPTTFPSHDWVDPPLRVPKCCTVDESGEPQDALQSYRLLSAYKTFTINSTFDEEPPFLSEKIAEVKRRKDVLDSIDEELKKKRKLN